MSTIPPNWVTLIWVKLWLLNSLFSHFWILLNLQPAITIGKEKGNYCFFFFFLSKLRLLAPCEQEPEWHFYTKLNHSVYCYVSYCHSVKICLYLHAKKFSRVFFTIFNSHQNQLQCAPWYGMMFRWKEELFSVNSLKTRIGLQLAIINDEWTQQINSNYG